LDDAIQGGEVHDIFEKYDNFNGTFFIKKNWFEDINEGPYNGMDMDYQKHNDANVEGFCNEFTIIIQSFVVQCLENEFTHFLQIYDCDLVFRPMFLKVSTINYT
jgi:hypothetical protein